MDDTVNNPYYTDSQQQVDYPLHADDGVIEIADPLALPIEDEELVKTIDERIHASNKFFNGKYNLKERRKKNEMYLFGRQLEDPEAMKLRKIYDAAYLDNALYEIESSLKPLAMSHLPDIMVLPGSDDPEKAKTAKDVSLAVDDSNKKRKQRQALSIAFKHLPVYYTAVLKARWDVREGKYGDYRFDVVHPEYIVIDHTATTPNTSDMSFIAECLPMTVQDAFMR